MDYSRELRDMFYEMMQDVGAENDPTHGIEVAKQKLSHLLVRAIEERVQIPKEFQGKLTPTGETHLEVCNRCVSTITAIFGKGVK